MAAESIILPLLGLLAVVPSQSQNCDELGVLVYEDLGCQAQETNGSCPSSFNCDLVPAVDSCIYQGKAYKNGELLDKNKYGFSCHNGCFCNPTHERNHVVCPVKKCLDDIFTMSDSSCYYAYDFKQCCAIDLICSPFDDTTTCTVDGSIYNVGERFIPKNSCHTCVCAKGFEEGKFEEPHCKRLGCDEQISQELDVQKFCAPVYRKSQLNGNAICCPNTWMCQDGTETVFRININSNNKCKYGKEEFNIGDSFIKTIQYPSLNDTITCICEIPPLMQCFDRF